MSTEDRARAALQDSTVLSVMHLCRPPERGGDELVLLLENGKEVTISAPRLRLAVKDWDKAAQG